MNEKIYDLKVYNTIATMQQHFHQQPYFLLIQQTKIFNKV